MVRRIFYQHTTGPYVGLRQLVAMEMRHEQGHGALGYIATGEIRTLEPGPMPDRLKAAPMFPDGRMAKAMRLKTTDKWVLYREVPNDQTLG